MMIRGVPCYFSKASEAAKEFREAVGILVSRPGRRVLYVADLALTTSFAGLLADAAQCGVEVQYVDHHVPAGVAAPRDSEYAAGLTVLRESGVTCRVGPRSVYPSCLSLVLADGPVPSLGGAAVTEAARHSSVLVLADQDADGFWSALGLCGITYEGMKADADILDGPRGGPGKLTPLARLWTEAGASLPTFNKADPLMFKEAWRTLARHFVNVVQAGPLDGWSAVGGPTEAQQGRRFLEEAAKSYQEVVARANAVKLREEFDGRLVLAYLPDDKQRLDLTVLKKRMEAGGALVTAVVQTMGSIVSAGHSRQVQVDTTRKLYPPVDLRCAVARLPDGPEHGVIGNVHYRIYVTLEIFDRHVRPWLAKVFNAEPPLGEIVHRGTDPAPAV